MSKALINFITRYQIMVEEKSDLERMINDENIKQKSHQEELEHLEACLTDADAKLIKLKLKNEKEFIQLLSSLMGKVSISGGDFRFAEIKFSFLGKEYKIFQHQLFLGFFSDEKSVCRSYAKMILGRFDNMGVESFSKEMLNLLKFAKELQSNPNVVTDQLIARECEKTQKSIKAAIKREQTEISKNESLLAKISENVGEMVLRDNLINRLFRRKQLKLQLERNELTSKIKQSKDKMFNLNLQLDNEEQIDADAKRYVDTELKEFEAVMEIFYFLDERKNKIATFVSQNQDVIKNKINLCKNKISQTEQAKKDCNQDLLEHKEVVKSALIQAFENDDLVEALKNAQKENFSKENWVIICALRSYYNQYYTSKIDSLLG